MKYSLIVILFLNLLFSCTVKEENKNTRIWKDSVGFAVYSWQLDSIMNRLDFVGNNPNTAKVLISPHDDYKYVGELYPQVLSSIKADKLIIFGVAHKAKQFKNKDQLIFGTYDNWNSAYGNIKIWNIREKILEKLNPEYYTINDSLMQLEHSIEALLPFLQYYNRNIEILPILVPYNSFQNLNKIAKDFSNILYQLLSNEKMEWGNDFAIIISNDAIHYGNEEWGGKNLAPFGVDSVAYKKVLDYENLIIETSLVHYIDTIKINKFMSFTTKQENYTEYKWTWCGRYSIPAGLLTSYWLSEYYDINLFGELINYSTSINGEKIKVEDLKMGVTAPANIKHWVGYTGIIYK